MANPTSLDKLPGLLAASTSDQSLALNPDREYTLEHLGVDAAGSAALTPIFLQANGDATASYAAAEGKSVLRLNGALVIGPGVSSLGYKTASGAPTFQVQPSGSFRGDY